MQKITASISFAVLFALSGALSGCNAQESKPTVVVSAPAPSSIATPAEGQTSAPLVSGLPDFTRLVDFVAPAVVNIRVSEKVQAQSMPDMRNHPICQICLMCRFVMSSLQPPMQKPQPSEFQGKVRDS